MNEHYIVTSDDRQYCVACCMGEHDDCQFPDTCGCDGTCEVWPGKDWRLRENPFTAPITKEIPDTFPVDWL